MMMMMKMKMMMIHLVWDFQVHNGKSQKKKTMASKISETGVVGFLSLTFYKH